MATKQIGWIFWDLGGVLIDFDYDAWRAAMAELFHTTPEILHDFWTTPYENGLSPYHRADLGTHTEQDTRKLFSTRFGEVSTGQFRKAFLAGQRGLLPSVELIRKLSTCPIQQGVISNLNSLHFEYVVETYPTLLSLVRPELCFFSVIEGMRKGSAPGMYRHVLRICKAKPAECCLVDDLEENLIGFRAVGGTAILFQNPQQLEEEFKRLQILP